MTVDHPLRPLMEPRSIAVIGASPRGNRGAVILRNLRRFGYAGALHAVNPKYRDVEGVTCVSTLADLPQPAEFVAVVLPAPAAVETVRLAAAAGTKAGLVIGGGFGEGDGAGRQLQAELAEICRTSGMKLCGPNCYGILNVHFGAAPFSGEIVDPLTPGGVGFAIQSGAVSHAVHNTAVGRGLAISHLVTSGNEAVVELSEYVDWMVEDPHTRVIALFIEGLKNPARFAKVAERALALGKPIVALKVGRTERGRRSTLAHTGSVAGSDDAYDGLFRKYGVVRVDDLDEMREALLLFSAPRRLTRGQGFALASISGGITTLVSDLAEEHGLATPEPSTATREAIEAAIPRFGVVSNPLDTTGVLYENPGILKAVADAFLADPAIGCFGLALNTPLGTAGHHTRARTLAEVQRATEKPIVCFSVSSAGADPELVRVLGEAGVPFLMGARESVLSLRRWAWWQERRAAMVAPRGRLAQGQGRRLPAEPAMLAERAATALLQPYGVPFVAQRSAGTKAGAIAAADELGYPVAVKIDAPDIAHKSEIGGIRLNLRDASEVAAAFDHVTTEARRFVPQAAIEGVLVQRMAPRGVEALVGVVRDPEFGPQIAVGLGGVFVEALRQVVLRPLPIDAADAEEMIGETMLGRMLEGFRGGGPADREALAAALLAVSDAACDLGARLLEIDLNPVIVLPRGAGVCAVDALIVLKEGLR